MAEPIKNTFNSNSLLEFARAIQAAYAPFDEEEFLKSTLNETWENLELKARVRQISTQLGKFLPAEYEAALGIIDKLLESYDGPCLFCLPDFVEVFGQHEKYLSVSLDALGRYTQYFSSEFAIRPFIIEHEDFAMAQMLAWATDSNEHLRRLSSEGCRPQLPWGQALVKYKKDPTPILPILEKLKADPSAYVRKSVANNLNDISKTHPDLVISIAKDWYGKNEATNWIVKHGCRTLLKKGNREVLSLFGYHGDAPVTISSFSLNAKSIAIGDSVVFSFDLLAKKAAKIRLEYAIDYVKHNGKRNRKIFQLSEFSVNEGTSKQYNRKHSFADVSTRKHYPGPHTITLIINGTEHTSADFLLSK